MWKFNVQNLENETSQRLAKIWVRQGRKRIRIRIDGLQDKSEGSIKIQNLKRVTELWCSAAWWYCQWHVCQVKRGSGWRALGSLSAVSSCWICSAASLCTNWAALLSASAPSSASLSLIHTTLTFPLMMMMFLMMIMIMMMILPPPPLTLMTSITIPIQIDMCWFLPFFVK